MRIVFFGTPEFAREHLRALVSSAHEVVAVVTRPDKSQKRSKELVPSSVKQYCLEHLPQIPLLQPEKCSTQEFKAVLEGLNPDIFVVVAYGEIIKQFILDIPRCGAINVHASLLPKYRGAAPMQQALLHGEHESGVTIIRLVLKMDAGDILAIRKCAIPESMTLPELEAALVPQGISSMLEVLDGFEQGTVQSLPQDETKVTFAPKITVDNCRLDFSKEARELHNLVRAVTPHPGAWCEIYVREEKKRLKVLRSSYEAEQFLPVRAIGVNPTGELMIGTAKGVLVVHELQLEGKKAMLSKEFLKGVSATHMKF